MALCSRIPEWAGTRNYIKPIWILLKQGTVCGSGISWTICKSAHRPQRITMPAPHLSCSILSSSLKNYNSEGKYSCYVLFPDTDDAAFTSTSIDYVCGHDTVSTSRRHKRSTGADGSADELIGTMLSLISLNCCNRRSVLFKTEKLFSISLYGSTTVFLL